MLSVFFFLVAGVVRGQTIQSVLPNAAGTPNSVTAHWPYEFVSVQGTGQIVTYDISSGTPVLSSTYKTPCAYPSGMVIAHIESKMVMAAPCYDTGTLLTLALSGKGVLSPLGSVSGLVSPYPGIVLDGTDVYVAEFGGVRTANGSVVRVSIANPATPVITASVTLASPFPGGFVNPAYMAIGGGTIIVEAGSENYPYPSSTVQAIDEASMTLLGTPLAVDHSPQQVAIRGKVAYVTFYDAEELLAVDFSKPGQLTPVQKLALPGCAAEPIAIKGDDAYVGCVNGGVLQIDLSKPGKAAVVGTLDGVMAPQRIKIKRNYLLVTDGDSGGMVYQIDLQQ
jgi:hypothetical protein